MKLIEPAVRLAYATPESLIPTAARASYQSYEGQDADSDTRLIRHFVRNDESPLEFSFAAFDVTCSYATHVHFLRHRHLSQSWLSARYTEQLGFVLPPAMTDEYSCVVAQDAYRDAAECYESLRQWKEKKQDARYVMPQGAAVQGWIAGNARAWLHTLNLRASKKAMPETRLIALTMREELSKVWPTVFGEADA